MSIRMQRQQTAKTTTRVTDRRLEQRFIGAINGCYTLSDRRLIRGTGVEVFACRTQSISPFAAAVTAPVLGGVGEGLTARLDGLGIMRGEIERHLDDGFVFTLVASEDQRDKLAKRLSSLRRRSVVEVQDKRGHQRHKPIDPRSVITLAGGTTMRCFVIDLSRSGAALSADLAPEVGTPLVVGKLACRVVRPLDVGFVVKFDAVQDADEVELLVTGFDLHEPPSPIQ
jgi:hypothetical protein